MASLTQFGSRSTADQVIAGIDLSGRRFAVTGCDSGLGFETMNALAANGAQVIGLARTSAAAEAACRVAGRLCAPVACDLSDLGSVAAAAATIRELHGPLDAIVANAGVAFLPTLEVRHGVEMQFLVNHIGHFALLNALTDIVRDAAGRVVIVSGGAVLRKSAVDGIEFDNLAGGRSYDPKTFYQRSKLAVALYAKELSRRLARRGIAVNAVDPGAARGTRIHRHRGQPWLLRAVTSLFEKSPERAAATQTLLAAHPGVAGHSGEVWADCRVVEAHPLVGDAGLAQRLWEASDAIVKAHAAAARPAEPEFAGVNAAGELVPAHAGEVAPGHAAEPAPARADAVAEAA
jgi:WW domain-containing oxidoreductase